MSSDCSDSFGEDYDRAWLNKLIALKPNINSAAPPFTLTIDIEELRWRQQLTQIKPSYITLSILQLDNFPRKTGSILETVPVWEI